MKNYYLLLMKKKKKKHISESANGPNGNYGGQHEERANKTEFIRKFMIL